MIKFIRDIWTVHVERAKARKAVRLLTKQSWSVEFLVYILTKSVELSRKECHIVLRNPDGQEVIIYAGMPQAGQLKQKEEQLNVMDANAQWEAIRDAAEVRGLL